MNNDFNKTPVFLIDMSQEADYALFLEERGTIGSDTPKKLSGHTFILEQMPEESCRRRYLCITLFGPRMFWSGDSELRPLGKFTSAYVPIGGRAITLTHYFEIRAAMDKEDSVSATQTHGYYVEADSHVKQILEQERYEGWHRPWFAMPGSTHRVYHLCPFQQTYLDAASKDVQSIPAATFVSMYKATYERCEPMDFCDYKAYLAKAKQDGNQSEPVVDETVEGLYGRANEQQPVGILRIPNNTRRIPPKTFQTCGGITDVIFPDGLTTIDTAAFADCQGILRIYLPKSVQQIQYGAFHNCDSLVEVYYAGSQTAWKALLANNISDKSKRQESGIARLGNDELLRVRVRFDCEM